MKLATTFHQLIASTLLLGVATAQSDTFSRIPATEIATAPVDENGLSNFSGERQTITPWICSPGCAIPIAIYRNCFYNATLYTGDVLVSDQDLCDEWLCDIEGYQQLVACLECVVSNGNERPFGYQYNTSLTAAQTGSPVSELSNPVDGYLNETLANQWLANIVGRCSEADRTLEDVTTTVTATPTTTGPHGVRVTRGQTVNQETWTGLTQYSDRFSATGTLPWAAALETILSDFEAGSTGGQYTPTGGGASATASAEATSSPNAGIATVPMGSYAWCLAVLGLLWI